MSNGVITINIKYVFANGVTIDYVIQKDPKNPIAKCEWSCALTKDNIAPLMDEYAFKAIPYVYQKIANFTGESILWIDKHLHYPTRLFKPQKSNN